MRATAIGRYSLERVFADVHIALPGDINATIVRLPFESRGLIPRLRNLAFTARLRADVVHVGGDVHYCVLAIRRTRSVLTVPDLVTLHRLQGIRRRALFLLWYRLPTWWAARVTTISQATKNELVQVLPARAAKTSVVPCPVGNAFLNAQRTPQQRELPQILQVGTGANKNLERVISAIASLPVHLRIVGSLSDKQRLLLDGTSLSYSAVENLCEEGLVREYTESDVLSFMSTYEGFGLPIIEAQAVGLPVITSNVSSMPEVAGEGALLVDPLDTGAIRDAVALLIKSPDLAQSLVARGHQNVTRFLPGAIAEMYADIYRGMGQPGAYRRRSWMRRDG
ncbi:MAG TPA: glycosyltransferase family 1 protein [Acidimicrobiales bacterium]|nr:glycosyltransferase family 1 protein [Acidimicrobiales bacterium]